MEGIDNFLEQAVEGVPLALPLLEVNVGKLPCHPAGFGPQVAIGAVKAGHDIVLQEALQMVLVWSLRNTLARCWCTFTGQSWNKGPQGLSKQGLKWCRREVSGWFPAGAGSTQAFALVPSTQLCCLLQYIVA